MTSALQLYVIRHGETAWSLSGQYTGRTDLPLTAYGEQVASELAPSMKVIPFSRVLTSPRLRAQTTCKLAGLGAFAEVEPDMAEWDYGDYEGLKTSDILDIQPDWDIWRDGCPSGESPSDISARADRLIASLDSLNGSVALFSHGQFGRVLAARWIGLAAREGQHLTFDPAHIGILACSDHHPGRKVITLWNATPASLQSDAKV
jgi:probable phosphoglycerate mutase